MLCHRMLGNHSAPSSFNCLNMYSISAHLICHCNNNNNSIFDLQILVWAGLVYSLECEAVELFRLSHANFQTGQKRPQLHLVGTCYVYFNSSFCAKCYVMAYEVSFELSLPILASCVRFLGNSTAVLQSS